MPYDRFQPLNFDDNVPAGTFGDGETPDPWALWALAPAPEGDDE